MEERYMHDGLMSGFLARWRYSQAAKFISSGNTVLDIACNEGGLIDYLPPHTNYLGIDLSETALKVARRVHPEYQFLLADVSYDLPELNNKFDVAVMLAFVEHIKEPEHIINAVKTLLKPDGQLVITTPAPWARAIHDIGSQVGIFSQEGAEDHEKFWSRRDLFRLAETTQMRVVTFYHFMFGFNQMLCLQKI